MSAELGLEESSGACVVGAGEEEVVDRFFDVRSAVGTC